MKEVPTLRAFGVSHKSHHQHAEWGIAKCDDIPILDGFHCETVIGPPLDVVSRGIVWIAHDLHLSNASVYDGGDKVSPGSPGQTAVRRTEWFGGGPSRHWLGDARGAGGHTAKETTIRETVQCSYGNGGLAAWEVGEAEGPSVALRGPTIARGS